MKLPTLSSPLKLFSPAPAQPALGVAGLGGSMLFASSGGGGGYDPDDDVEYDDFSYDDEASAEEPATQPERRPRATRSSRSAAPAPGGRPRTSQFQPEERYWTDYLRIALPVIGLLLMIGLLWFWADRLINDDPETTEPVPTEDIGLVTTASPTPPAQIQSTPPPPTTGGTTSGTTTGQETPEAPPANTGTTETTTEDEGTTETAPPDDAGGNAFSDGQSVTAVEDLNLRPNPSTEGEVLMVVSAGDTLTINGGPEEGETYVWWEVVTADGTIGWVVEDFIEPAE